VDSSKKVRFAHSQVAVMKDVTHVFTTDSNGDMSPRDPDLQIGDARFIDLKMDTVALRLLFIRFKRNIHADQLLEFWFFGHAPRLKAWPTMPLGSDSLFMVVFFALPPPLGVLPIFQIVRER